LHAWVAELTEPMIESLQSAARKLTGFRRRQFQAEMTLKYCAGRGRRSERVFGWGRETVDSLSASINDTYGDSQGVTRGVAGVLASSVRTVGNSLVLGGMKSRSKTLPYNADPVTDKNDIYLDYLAFANAPNLLMESSNKPKCGYHILRQFNGKWYWIPTEAAPMFLALVLKTSMMRGPELMPPPYYERKITKVVHINSPEPDVQTYVIQLDQAIPFGDGYLRYTGQEKLEQRDIHYFTKALTSDDGKTVFPATQEGQPSEYFRVTVSKEDQQKVTELDGKSVQIFSDKFPPVAQRPSDQLQQLQDSVRSVDVNIKNLFATPK
jgi:hypothetical protein